MVVHTFRDRGAVAHLCRRSPLLLLLRLLRHRQEQEEAEGPGTKFEAFGHVTMKSMINFKD